MRTKHKVKFPETTGPLEYNRAHRVQQNTLEQLPNFLISLWLSSLFYGTKIFSLNFEDAQIASVLGCFWVILRLFYSSSYREGGNITTFTIPAYMVNNLNLALAIYSIVKSFVLSK